MFADYRRAAAFFRDLIHAPIVETVWPALARGDYDAAILQAFRAVEEAVREAGGYGTLIAVLIRCALLSKPTLDLLQLCINSSEDAVASLQRRCAW